MDLDQLSEEPDPGPWGVYEEPCIECGEVCVIVATVDSVEGGYAEWWERRLCKRCRADQDKKILLFPGVVR